MNPLTMIGQSVIDRSNPAIAQREVMLRTVPIKRTCLAPSLRIRKGTIRNEISEPTPRLTLAVPVCMAE